MAAERRRAASCRGGLPAASRSISRLYGFGSIYGKTIRDSRLAFIIAAGLLGGLALVMGAAVGERLPDACSPRSRSTSSIAQHARRRWSTSSASPVEARHARRLHDLEVRRRSSPSGTALWSILALSGTLAGEARRGSLDFVAATPFGKRRIALEKLAAHLTMLGARDGGHRAS